MPNPQLKNAVRILIKDGSADLRSNMSKTACCALKRQGAPTLVIALPVVGAQKRTQASQGTLAPLRPKAGMNFLVWGGADFSRARLLRRYRKRSAGMWCAG